MHVAVALTSLDGLPAVFVAFIHACIGWRKGLMYGKAWVAQLNLPTPSSIGCLLNNIPNIRSIKSCEMITAFVGVIVAHAVLAQT